MFSFAVKIIINALHVSTEVYIRENIVYCRVCLADVFTSACKNFYG